MRVALAALVLLAGCMSGSFPPDDSARAASGAPDAFLVRDGQELRPSRPADACRTPMVDPRDRAELTLVRSQAGRGDYEVPGDRYGVLRGELLRIDCATGRPIGIVRGE